MIHSQAIIDKQANLASDVEVGPWTFIGPDVEIDSGTVVGPHVVINGPTRIGKNNRIFQFSSVGEECQDKKYKGEPTRLEIGDNNVIRESCTIHRGTTQDNSLTKIGSGNLLMAYVHVAHDCMVGDNNIFANNASLAGHVHVDHDVVLGGFSGVHQFCQIGAHSMASMGSMIVKDVPAFVMVSGDTARPHGMNVEGMRRRNYSKEMIVSLRNAYKVVYRQGLTVKQAIEELNTWDQFDQLTWFIDSIKNSNRGITR
ncbi:MAG: acyl-[acyl-carrier-protein]--UDP-N-acetylglucosamine O-acyltransferase [Gammaproteobacteria bacterium]|nr:MAG: acyl-[acyl-carrier-protein]--UDP-N-acetylglucosamine O-acyltransferase [Gammaproteobacteria bacterium]